MRSFTAAPSPNLLSFFFITQDTDGGALNVHDSPSVIFLGDLSLEYIEVEGSGGGMYITKDVSRR